MCLLALASALFSGCRRTETPTFDPTLYLWSEDGKPGVNVTTYGTVFGPDGKTGEFQWFPLNQTFDEKISIIGRVVTCNGRHNFECPFEVSGTRCETPIMQIEPGTGYPELPLHVRVNAAATCRVPLTENPMEWLRNRNRWEIEFVTTTADGGQQKMDPEVQIDRNLILLDVIAAVVSVLLAGAVVAGAFRSLLR